MYSQGETIDQAAYDKLDPSKQRAYYKNDDGTYGKPVGIEVSRMSLANDQLAQQIAVETDESRRADMGVMLSLASDPAFQSYFEEADTDVLARVIEGVLSIGAGADSEEISASIFDTMLSNRGIVTQSEADELNAVIDAINSLNIPSGWVKGNLNIPHVTAGQQTGTGITQTQIDAGRKDYYASHGYQAWVDKYGGKYESPADYPSYVVNPNTGGG
jgi:hypothetical protein